jgi:hypothetical protein
MALNPRWWLTTDSCQTVIDATPEHVYDLVSDLPRMGSGARSASGLSGSTA